MKLFPRIILYITAIAVLSWFLPWLYALTFPATSSDPFCAFSPVSGEWIATTTSPGGKTLMQAINNSGEARTINRNERDSLAPQIHYRELIAHDRLPDSIDGKEVSAHLLRTSELVFISYPREIIKRTPGVWMMMESMPLHVDLSDADQVFRFTADNRMEFIDMATNTVNPTRSKRFTETLQKRGFSFPATDLSANVTAKKQYDEGYLMVDDAGHVFHIKQQGGRPYVAAIPMPENSPRASKVFIWEEQNRNLLGLVIDEEFNPYIIEHNGGYRVIPLPEELGKINPETDGILAMGNLFNIVFRITGKDSTRWSAIDTNDYTLLGVYDITKEQSAAARISGYIFPYILSFTSTGDSIAYPRIGRISFDAIWLNAVLCIILIGFATRRKRTTAWTWTGIALTIPLGIYVFLPFLLLRD